jgi:hypothetical protein
MPIDKSQSVGGLRFHSGDCGSIDCYSQEDTSTTIKEIEEDPCFRGWTTETSSYHNPVNFYHDDYEVNSDGKLIRLGDQIDEELYPAEGLNYFDSKGRGWWHNGGKSVGKLMADSDFSHWKDTPKNRELGLYKEKEKPMTESEFKGGDRIRVTKGNWKGQYGHLRVFVPKTNPGLMSEGPGWHVDMDDGKRRLFLESSLEPTTSKEDLHIGTPDGGTKKAAVLHAGASKQMVDTQSKSLQYEETSWLKARLPDNRILEAPMPDGRGWEETYSETWQPGEAHLCFYGPVGNDDRAGIFDEFIYDVNNPLRVPITAKNQRMWWKDMAHLFQTFEKKGPVTIGSSIIAAKKFRRRVKPKPSFGYIGHDVDGGRGQGCLTTFDYEPTEEQSWTLKEGVRQKAEALYAPNPDWPESGHPSRTIQGSSPSPKAKRMLNLLDSIEDPAKGPYDDSCWPK